MFVLLVFHRTDSMASCFSMPSRAYTVKRWKINACVVMVGHTTVRATAIQVESESQTGSGYRCIRPPQGQQRNEATRSAVRHRVVRVDRLTWQREHVLTLVTNTTTTPYATCVPARVQWNQLEANKRRPFDDWSLECVCHPPMCSVQVIYMYISWSELNEIEFGRFQWPGLSAVNNPSWTVLF